MGDEDGAYFWDCQGVGIKSGLEIVEFIFFGHDDGGLRLVSGHH
jgi:hypothetical protein